MDPGAALKPSSSHNSAIEIPSIAPIRLISDPPEVAESHDRHSLVIFVAIVVVVVVSRRRHCTAEKERWLAGRIGGGASSIDQHEEGMGGTFEVYVLNALEIDRRLTFDDADALQRLHHNEDPPDTSH